MWHKYLTKKKQPALSFDLFMKDFINLPDHEAQKFRHELIDQILLKELNAQDKKFLKRIGVEVDPVIKIQFLWIPYLAKTDNWAEIFAECKRIELENFGSFNRYLFTGLVQCQPNLIKFTSKKQERAVLEEFKVLIKEYKAFPSKTLAYKWVKFTNTKKKQNTIYDYLRRP